MFYALLALSLTSSAVALPHWLKLFRKAKHVPSLADESLPEEPGLIAAILPRRARAVWNALCGFIAFLLMGTLHWFSIQGAVEPGLSTFVSSLLYLATLALWLCALALPARLIRQWRLPAEQ